MNDAINTLIAELTQHAETAVRTEYEKTVEMLKGRVATLERELASTEADLADTVDTMERTDAKYFELRARLQDALAQK